MKLKFVHEFDVMTDKFIIIPIVTIMISYRYEHYVGVVFGFMNFTFIFGVGKK